MPEYLAKAYGVRFVDGQPGIPGWGAAIARAEAIIHIREHAWLEDVASLSAELAGARTVAGQTEDSQGAPGAP